MSGFFNCWAGAGMPGRICPGWHFSDVMECSLWIRKRLAGLSDDGWTMCKREKWIKMDASHVETNDDRWSRRSPTRLARRSFLLTCTGGMASSWLEVCRLGPQVKQRQLSGYKWEVESSGLQWLLVFLVDLMRRSQHNKSSMPSRRRTLILRTGLESWMKVARWEFPQHEANIWHSSAEGDFLSNCQCQFLLLSWLRSLWLSWTMSCKRAKLNPMKMRSEQSPFTLAPNESWIRMHFQKLGWNIFSLYKSCTA